MNLRAAALAAALALSPSLAFAQPAAPDAQARAAFDRGIADVDAGRFANAVAAFEESYRLRPAAVVLYNLASAYTRMGRHQQAIATYERYLSEGAPASPPTAFSRCESASPCSAASCPWWCCASARRPSPSPSTAARRT